MEYNIYFNNFENVDFKSKNSKNLIKKYIKSNIDILNEKNNEMKKIIIEKYLNSDNVDFNFSINNNNLFINKINVIDKNNLLIKLKNKINNNDNKELNKINDNDNDNKNYDKYNILIQKNKNIPSHYEIKNNKSKYIKEIIDHLIFFINKYDNKELIHKNMDNMYINYISENCEFDYKLYFEKIYESEKIKKDN
tara:strand:- start:1271 stop:1852 length:582 start_codon:yes stop_codon:yes gene_type:complete